MARCVHNPQILAIHLIINVRMIRHVYHWSMVTNVIARSAKRARIAKKASTYCKIICFLFVYFFTFLFIVCSDTFVK